MFAINSRVDTNRITATLDITYWGNGNEESDPLQGIFLTFVSG